MSQLMSDMGVVMDTSLKYFLKVQLSISQEIIECLVILLLTDAVFMMNFAMQSSIPTALRLMPLSGFTHPAALPALMIAWAFGANWNRLILQYGKDEVDLFLVSKEDIAQELKNAQLMGVRVELEEFISQRLGSIMESPSRVMKVLSLGPSRVRVIFTRRLVSGLLLWWIPHTLVKWMMTQK